MASREHHKTSVQVLKPDADPEGFARQLRQSSTRLLMLDYDGTLAPFVDQRDRAYPYPGVRDLLARLSEDTRNRVVIISGRAIEDLRPLLGVTPLPELWGSHGWERLQADGHYVAPQFPEGLQDMIEREWAWMLRAFDRDRLEKKPASIAVHWRGLPDTNRRTVEQEARKRWHAFREMDLFDLHAFDGGLELRVAGRTKGDAVHALLAETPVGTPAAYLGDDLTDEDAFAALDGRGLRVLVRRDLRPTRADVQCIPPEGLLMFLNQWVTLP